MTTWRYKARDPSTLEVVSSVIHADTDAAARAALRKAGLRPVRVKPVRASRADGSWWGQSLDRHLRARRVQRKADFYDSLATLLDAGIPLSTALRTMGSTRAGQRRAAELAHAMSDAIQGGSSLAEAMRGHGSWFDEAEIAMIDAGQRSGEMGSILGRLADRQSRSGELSSKITGALAYPMLVCVIGIGVTIFLSVKTLPELVGILRDAEVEPPGLTLLVMGMGQFVWHNGFWLICGLLVLLILSAVGLSVLRQRAPGRLARAVGRCTPRVFMRIRSSEAMLSLAELLKTGVTLVDSLRIVAPTLRGVLGSMLAGSLDHAAGEIEQGEPVSCIFDDGVWFTQEHRQLMAAGEAAGEMSRTLERIGQRELRSARRLLDRLAAMIEPAAILLLAVLVGTVVMAAVLPLVRLQEIVG